LVTACVGALRQHAGVTVSTTVGSTVELLADLAFAHPPRAANPPAFDTVLDLLRERGLDPQVGVARDERAVLAAVAAGTSFGLTTGAPFSAPGVAWLDLAPRALALRARVVRRRDDPARAGAASAA